MRNLLQRLYRAAQGLAVAAACLSTALAHAQAPPLWPLKLEFLHTTGQVSPTESIPVYLRLTNTDPYRPFSFDAVTGIAGIPTTALPATGQWLNPETSFYEEVEFASYTGFRLSSGYWCSGTFTAGGQECLTGTAYTFTFDHHFGSSFQLGAGQSYDYRYGVFDPVAGGAPAGTYELYRATLTLSVLGLAADGRELIGSRSLGANTCSLLPADCVASGLAFTRTVVAVPEPANGALLLAGLLALAAIERRHRSGRSDSRTPD